MDGRRGWSEGAGGAGRLGVLTTDDSDGAVHTESTRDAGGVHHEGHEDHEGGGERAVGGDGFLILGITGWGQSGMDGTGLGGSRGLGGIVPKAMIWLCGWSIVAPMARPRFSKTNT